MNRKKQSKFDIYLEKLEKKEKEMKKKNKIDETKPKTHPDYPMTNLIIAMVNSAVTDWILSYAYLLKHPIKDPDTAKPKQLNNLHSFTDADNFFKSEWFRELINNKITYDWLSRKMIICANYKRPSKAIIYFRKRVKYILRNEML